MGNLGETRYVGEGVHELKIDYGPGYRLYFGNAGADIVLLLCGSDKSTRDADIQVFFLTLRDVAEARGKPRCGGGGSEWTEISRGKA